MLTPREKQVAGLIVEGQRDKTIAATLGLSFHTVRGHLKAIFRKLQVTKRNQVAPAFQREIS